MRWIAFSSLAATQHLQCNRRNVLAFALQGAGAARVDARLAAVEVDQDGGGIRCRLAALDGAEQGAGFIVRLVADFAHAPVAQVIRTLGQGRLVQQAVGPVGQQLAEKRFFHAGARIP